MTGDAQKAEGEVNQRLNELEELLKTVPDVKHLGKVSNEPSYHLDTVPWLGAPDLMVEFECKDFTSLCPVTGQPDFAEVEIEYKPYKSLVETKSLKLFLTNFRDVRCFNELIADTIAEMFFIQVEPHWVNVEVHFHHRGGIAVNAQARRVSKKRMEIGS